MTRAPESRSRRSSAIDRDLRPARRGARWRTAPTGGRALIEVVARAHQFLTFSTPPNLQTAVAFGLAKADDFFACFAAEMTRRHDRLRALDLQVLGAQGAYFLNLDLRSTGFDGDDVAFCRHLVKTVGVAAIPLSAFYEFDPVRHLVRLCFAKQDAVLDRASNGFVPRSRRTLPRRTPPGTRHSRM